jgi:hypothetical protein
MKAIDDLYLLSTCWEKPLPTCKDKPLPTCKDKPLPTCKELLVNTSGQS